jgi:hypothetical protein
MAEACLKTGWQVHAYCLMEELARLGWTAAELAERCKSDLRDLLCGPICVPSAGMEAPKKLFRKNISLRHNKLRKMR